MKKTALKRSALKRSVDLLMAAALPALMSYSLIGEAVHEWTGTGMGALVLLHLWLNRGYLRSLGRGRYPAYRALQTVLAALCFLAMLGLLFSGIILSNYVFSAPHIRGLSALARQIHMACSFWGFMLMSLHLGLHWNMALQMTKRLPPMWTKLLRGLGRLTAVYGAFAFWKRDFPDYLFLRTHFLFLDYEEPILLFFLDYLAIMGLFIFCAHCGGKLLRGWKGKDHKI